ncbi:MAG TPA: hydrogenase formation protein HypD [Candidatus Cloacimonetes bacterium]|nr:hydrogenase formation protein HypD [Candidatus Cloacimonadota bacterium]HEX38094.1 hydrogenase formation protein HypD [Candidatus Cloacimonadota bacterium]
MRQDFRNNPKIKQLLLKITSDLTTLELERPLNLMEVCGTHTVSLLKFGFRHYFKDRIKFLSGPGCPVCVTSVHDIDKTISLAKKGYRIVTFGDLIKVPGSESSLEKEIAKGAKVDVVYNPLDTLRIAEQTKDEIVFIAVGFETTIPVIAGLVLDAYSKSIKNLTVLSLVKTMPKVLRFLLDNLSGKIDGFIMPGHVSVIIGSEPYKFIPEDFNIPCTISGFEPVDLGLGIESLVRQIRANKPIVDNRYTRMVKKEGNPAAKHLIESVFEPSIVSWRGFGKIEGSGLTLRDEFEDFDAEEKFDIQVTEKVEQGGCICGDIISGKQSPLDCTLFRTACTPEHPIGPCMVSFEGACSAFYKYGEK